MKGRIGRLMIIALVFMIFQSCKSLVQYTEPKTTDDNLALIDMIDKQNLEFENLEIKAKIMADFVDRKHPLKVSIRIKRDSIIWVSLNLNTGLPIGKASFTPDTIKILDRVNDMIYMGNYEQLEKRKGIRLNYDILQSIIVNEIWKNNTGSLKIVDKKVQKKESYNSLFYVVSPGDSSTVGITYRVGKHNNKIEAINFLDNKNSLDIEYSQFESIFQKLFPHFIAIATKSAEKQEKMEIEITKVNMDKNQRYPFKIIKRFEIINL
ncbi:MAG: DUF4292 domain-containing protein [Bacteroidales bacterium]|nr:DUF4292 domain-containing protein [Bacteroidales bacterium]MCF8457688.1 DUF4292 domain-containing protein [Bacteroidales bacterium]